MITLKSMFIGMWFASSFLSSVLERIALCLEQSPRNPNDAKRETELKERGEGLPKE